MKNSNNRTILSDEKLEKVSGALGRYSIYWQCTICGHQRVNDDDFYDGEVVEDEMGCPVCGKRTIYTIVDVVYKGEVEY